MKVRNLRKMENLFIQMINQICSTALEKESRLMIMLFNLLLNNSKTGLLFFKISMNCSMDGVTSEQLINSKISAIAVSIINTSTVNILLLFLVKVDDFQIPVLPRKRHLAESQRFQLLPKDKATFVTKGFTCKYLCE